MPFLQYCPPLPPYFEGILAPLAMGRKHFALLCQNEARTFLKYLPIYLTFVSYRIYCKSLVVVICAISAQIVAINTRKPVSQGHGT